MQDILVGSRRAELAAVRDGFCAAAHLQPQLQVLTASDLALIMHGLEHITAADVLATIRFEEGNFPSECALPAMLAAVVRAMDEPMLRQLLLFLRVMLSERAHQQARTCTHARTHRYTSQRFRT